MFTTESTTPDKPESRDVCGNVCDLCDASVLYENGREAIPISILGKKHQRATKRHIQEPWRSIGLVCVLYVYARPEIDPQ